MSQSYVIFAGDGTLCVGRARDGQATVFPPCPIDGAGLVERAQDIQRQLVELGYAGDEIVLALDSSWCLSATISSEGLERAGRRRGLGFRLEEHLPVSAEDVVSDYMDQDGGETLGVCCERARLKVLVEALVAAGIRLGHICPAALMAAAYVVEHHPRADAVLLADGEAGSLRFDLFELRNGKPQRWWWFADDVMLMRDRLCVWLAGREGPTRIAMTGCDAASLGDVAYRPAFQITEMSDGHARSAMLHATKILGRAANPWIDLRCDAPGAGGERQVHRRAVLSLTIAVATLLLSISGVMQWRGRQYAALTTAQVQQQADVFKSAMPNQRVPGSIHGRLLSERRRLAGLGGQADEASALRLDTTSALSQLREILKSLPAELRYQITDLSVQPELIRIEGRARSHAEAEALAVAVRQTGRYEAEPPKTEATADRGVSFVFTARPVAASPLTKGGQP